MRAKLDRCVHCRQELTRDEEHYYGGSCENCETDYMYRLNDVTGWRWWIRVICFWWRRITAGN